MTWKLSEQEAIVVLFCSPPPSAYFGFTPYVMYKRLQNENKYLFVFGSMDDTANIRTFRYFDNQLQKTTNPFYSNVFLTLSGNRKMYEEVGKVLNQALGIDPDFYNNELKLPFGDNLLNLSYGLDGPFDRFGLFFRQGLFA